MGSTPGGSARSIRPTTSASSGWPRPCPRRPTPSRCRAPPPARSTHHGPRSRRSSTRWPTRSCAPPPRRWPPATSPSPRRPRRRVGLARLAPLHHHRHRRRHHRRPPGPDPDLPERSVDCVLEVHSKLDPGLVLSADRPVARACPVAARFGDDPDLQLLVTLRRAARVWGPISRLLDQALPERLELDDEEASELFGPVADELAAAGLSVLWPAEVLRVLDLRPVITTPRPASVTEGSLSLSTLAEMRWRATLDGEELTDAELDLLAEAKRPMVRLRGRWVRADPEQLARLKRAPSDPHRRRAGRRAHRQLLVDGDTVEAEIQGPLAELAERLRSLEQRPAFQPPPGLHASCVPTRSAACSGSPRWPTSGSAGCSPTTWGWARPSRSSPCTWSVGAPGPPSSSAPPPCMGNWQREAARFAPGIDRAPPPRLGRSSRTSRPRRDRRHHLRGGAARRRGPGRRGVGAGRGRRGPGGEEPVLAHRPSPARDPRGARIALTGTPVENRLSDLWALLDWTTPGLLGPLDQFQRQVAVPIERDRDDVVTERLADTVRPFLLRRRKTDPSIAPDLPEKTETDRFVGLTTEQATLYRAVVDRAARPGRTRPTASAATAWCSSCSPPSSRSATTPPTT
jgi:hypothetical protein